MLGKGFLITAVIVLGITGLSFICVDFVAGTLMANSGKEGRIVGNGVCAATTLQALIALDQSISEDADLRPEAYCKKLTGALPPNSMVVVPQKTLVSYRGIFDRRDGALVTSKTDKPGDHVMQVRIRNGKDKSLDVFVPEKYYRQVEIDVGWTMF